uniref:Uncharacterized protein n=1 Tax=Cucumis sativus TaxID=3659 RepID=A0A0A0KYG3_CUCSA
MGNYWPPRPPIPIPNPNEEKILSGSKLKRHRFEFQLLINKLLNTVRDWECSNHYNYYTALRFQISFNSTPESGVEKEASTKDHNPNKYCLILSVNHTAIIYYRKFHAGVEFSL